MKRMITAVALAGTLFVSNAYADKYDEVREEFGSVQATEKMFKGCYSQNKKYIGVGDIVMSDVVNVCSCYAVEVSDSFQSASNDEIDLLMTDEEFRFTFLDQVFQWCMEQGNDRQAT